MAYLLLRDLRSSQLLEFEIPEVLLGRDPAATVRLGGDGSEVVSTRHARFVEREHRWVLEDLGSRNGTFLNGRRLMPHAAEPVAAGQELRFGERGPRFLIEAVTREIVEATMLEAPRVARPSAPTVPLAAIDQTERMPADAFPSAPHGGPSRPPPLASSPTAPSPPRAPATPSPAQAAPPPKAPPPLRHALRLVVMDAESGEVYRAEGGRIRVGRGRECEIRPLRPGDTTVSRVHAEIVVKPDGRVTIRDAQSRNGTLLNGARLTREEALREGDRLRLGDDGPELTVTQMELPSTEPELAPAAPDARRGAAAPPGPKEAQAPLGGARERRSFGGKGATQFFSDMFQESQQRGRRLVRVAVWSSVTALIGAVGVLYWYSERRVRRATAELERRGAAAQQAMGDSIRFAAQGEYDRLRAELESARAGSAPAAVVESLRLALVDAQQRTTILQASLERAEASLRSQLAAGDSIRRAAQAELTRLQSQLSAANQSGTSAALLDSLRQAMRQAEERAAAVASQVRAVRGVNLAGVAQANQSAIGLVETHLGADIFDGTGFVINASGYLVTNRHVVAQGGRSPDSVFVTMADQKVKHRADVVTVAALGGPDLAVLKIRGYSGPWVPQIDWQGRNVRQGEPAALIGFPAGLGNALDATGAVRTSMTAGIFSKVTADAINFDAFTIGGSSGSPIFNASGEVVAVHRAGLREAAGFGFAVPVRQLVPLLPPEVRQELGLRPST